MSSRRIRDLAEELNELVARIGITSDMDDDPGDDAEPQPRTPALDDWLETALDAYNMRRHRETVFGSPQLFGEPTWDIMLDLFIGELRNIRMQTTSVCIGSQVPQTTALRWIALLEKEGLVHRCRDKADCRRVYIQLTERALGNMVRTFYEPCLWIMERKRRSALNLSRIASGPGKRDEAREAIVADAIAEILARRPGPA